MVDKVQCPHCRKYNKIHKFCTFCGKELPLDDDQIRLMTAKPEVRCLNCGRPVEENQTRCYCGFEFGDIKCPDCETKNPYTNRFCTSCGEKLWQSDVYDYKYDESHFKPHLFNKLPRKLRNISVFQRYKSNFKKPVPGEFRFNGSLIKLQKVDDALLDICSRWKVVSPDYCINCLGIIKPDEYSCPKCGFDLSDSKKTVEQLKNEKNNYVQPTFDFPDMKLYDDYSSSFPPSIGESQFEYRERLKWEFVENNISKNNIKKALDIQNKIILDEKLKRPKRETEAGGYCGHSCRYFYEEYLDESGGLVADATGQVDYLCKLGYSTGGYCEYYEP